MALELSNRSIVRRLRWIRRPRWVRGMRRVRWVRRLIGPVRLRILLRRHAELLSTRLRQGSGVVTS